MPLCQSANTLSDMVQYGKGWWLAFTSVAILLGILIATAPGTGAIQPEPANVVDVDLASLPRWGGAPLGKC